ncbi:MAG: DHH family phosphoesterase [Bacilli bacterium]|nr:DHH family phosphoesterase [Bacilli bacterium]
MEDKFLNSLLNFYHISHDKYLELTKDSDLSNFTDGYFYKDISKAAQIAKEAMKNNKRIIVYGDYDADGVMGISILVKMFKMLNYEVSYYMPSRYIDGYGLNMDNAKKCVNQFDLVITVDNGITCNEPIQYLKDHDIEVIVIDHHTVQLPLPNADAFVHPVVNEYGPYATSGAYSAFMFSIEMLKRVDKYLATLASISLISDMMPLKGYNRRLLKAVIKDYIDNEFLQISLLAEHKKLDERVIGALIAPKINAIGRMIEDKSVNLIIKYFVSDDKEFILTYSQYMHDINEKRKELSKEVVNNILINVSDDALVSKVDIKEGLIGLVANGIMNKLHKPAIVFTSDKDGNLKGSARSVEGFNIVEAFKALDHYMINSGGHALAGGCSIKESDFENFKKDFINLVNHVDIVVKEKENVPISINDINEEHYNIYNSFSPFGEEWPMPLLSLKNVKVDALQFSRNGEHILTKIGNNAKLVGFFISKDSLSDTKFINLTGTLDTSSYKNIVSYEFHIKDYLKVN